MSAVNARYWRIDGHRAAVLLWTADEWLRLDPADRPADAQAYPGGAHAALRFE